MPILTYNLPSTNTNRPYRLYMGTHPVRGAFRYKYDSTNIKDGHYQVYPNIYTIQLSNYNSQKGGGATYYDNIKIELYNPQEIYTSGYYTIACNDSYAASIVTKFSQPIKFKISHNNTNEPEYKFDYLPVDVYVLLNVSPISTNNCPFPNYRVYAYDSTYFLQTYGTPPNSYLVVRIPSGTPIGDAYVNITPSDDIASVVQVVGITNKLSDNVDFFNTVWSEYNYGGSGFSVDSNEFCGNNWHAQIPGSQGQVYLNMSCAGITRPNTFLYTVNHQKRFTTEAQLKSFFNSVGEDVDELYSTIHYEDEGVHTAQNGYHFTINECAQESNGASYSKGVWFNTTINRGYNNSIIDYNDDVIYERNDLLTAQLYLTYSTNGAWYQSLTGTTYATYTFDGAYYKPTSYTTYQTWGSYSDSGPCRVEVSTSGAPPDSQSLVTYINTFKYIQFPVPNAYSDIVVGDVSYTNAFYSIGHYFYGYLTAPAVANTYIPNERYKGTYIFDFNEDNYITRFRYTIGTGCRWTTQRFFDTYSWLNRPSNALDPFGTYMNYSFGSLRATGAGYHTSLVWFYIWGVSKGRTVKCNNTTVTGVGPGGEPTWHIWEEWGGAVTGTDYKPRVGSNITNYVTFSAPSSGGWQISGITFNVSGIKLYDTNINFTINAETSTLYGDQRYFNIVTNGSNSQSTPISTITWDTQIAAPTGLNQTKEFDIYVMFKVLGSKSNSKEQEIWCTKLNNTNSSNGTNNSWIIRVSEPYTYKYKWLRID